VVLNAAARIDGVQCFQGESQAVAAGILDTRQFWRNDFDKPSCAAA